MAFGSGCVEGIDEGLDPLGEALGIERGYPIALTEAAKAANPYFRLGGGYATNCQRCVAVYELRRRGYDVVAMPKTRRASRDGIYGSHNCFVGAVIVGARSNPAADALDEAELEKMLNAYPDGSRFSICWTRPGKKTGHAVVCEKVAGALLFMDPTSGHIGKSVLGAADQDGYSFFLMNDLKINMNVIHLIAQLNGA